MDLRFWIIVWAAITTAALVLAFLRLTVGLHEVLGFKLGPHQKEFYAEQTKNERKLEMLDLVGIALTVVSVILVLTIGLIWIYQP